MKNEKTFNGRLSIGNAELWNESKIAFFASRDSGEATKEKIRCWGRNLARDGICFIGAFHSEAESALFHAALRNDGKAIWILGKSIPEKLSREEERALAENRLFIVSCLRREHYTAKTSRYANHVAAMHADAIVFAHISESSRLFSFYRRMNEKRKDAVTRIK